MLNQPLADGHEVIRRPAADHAVEGAAFRCVSARDQPAGGGTGVFVEPASRQALFDFDDFFGRQQGRVQPLHDAFGPGFLNPAVQMVGDDFAALFHFRKLRDSLEELSPLCLGCGRFRHAPQRVILLIGRERIGDVQRGVEIHFSLAAHDAAKPETSRGSGPAAGSATCVGGFSCPHGGG